MIQRKRKRKINKITKTNMAKRMAKRMAKKSTAVFKEAAIIGRAADIGGDGCLTLGGVWDLLIAKMNNTDWGMIEPFVKTFKEGHLTSRELPSGKTYYTFTLTGMAAKNYCSQMWKHINHSKKRAKAKLVHDKYFQVARGQKYTDAEKERKRKFRDAWDAIGT